jgi:hypothetical protein
MLQQSLFEVEESGKLHYYQEVSLANLIALQENVWRLMMSVIYGENLRESFAKLDPDGCWVRTYQGYYQVRMDDSLEEFSGTWPKWGIMRDGLVMEPMKQVPTSKAKGFLFWPRPTASDCSTRFMSLTALLKNMKKHQLRWTHFVLVSSFEKGEFGRANPEFGEWLMQIPVGWTELNQSEIQ